MHSALQARSPRRFHPPLESVPLAVHPARSTGNPSVLGSTPCGQHASPLASSRAAVAASGYAPSSSSSQYTRQAPASSGRIVKVPMVLSNLYPLVVVMVPFQKFLLAQEAANA